MTRPTKPRELVSPAPLWISQLSSLALLGIDARRFRETFGSHPGAVRVGKLLLVEAADVREALRARRDTSERDTSEQSANDADDDGGDDGPTGVDDVLARLGRRRAG